MSYVVQVGGKIGYIRHSQIYIYTLSLSVLDVKQNSVALEEYCTQKGKRKDPWKGRCDLFLAIGGEYFACESKQVWCAVSSKAKSGHSAPKAGLDAACAAARQLDRDEGRRLGISFAVPRVPKSDEEKLELPLTKWLKGLSNIDYSSIVWIFPEKDRRLMSEKQYLYPGVVLMAREVFRQK